MESGLNEIGSLKLYAEPYKLTTQKILVSMLEKSAGFDFFGVSYPVPDVCTINAFPGRVHEPTLLDGDCRVMGSRAICVHLEARFPTPPLLPQSPQSRALVEYIEECFYDFQDVVFRLNMYEDGGAPGGVKIDGPAIVNNRFRPVMKYFDSIGGTSRYLTSDRVSLADVSVGVTMQHFSKHNQISSVPGDTSIFGKLSPEFPRLKSYCEDLWARASFKGARNIASLSSNFHAHSVVVGSDGSATMRRREELRR
jgi:glutathione S-transferase